MKTLVLSLFAATSLLAAPAVLACDKEHAKQTTIAGKDCCASQAGTAGKGCPHMQATAEAKGEKPDCTHAKPALSVAKAGSDCPYARKQAAVLAKAVKTTDVKLTGRLVCEHCDLKQADGCNSVFQAEGETEYVTVEGEQVAGARAASEHGKNLLTIEGVLRENDEGAKVLEITRWEKAPEARS